MLMLLLDDLYINIFSDRFMPILFKKSYTNIGFIFGYLNFIGSLIISVCIVNISLLLKTLFLAEFFSYLIKFLLILFDI